MKSKIPYATAKKYADRIVQLLSPHCHRIEIAGSIRRRKEIVGDIEIVCIPKPYDVGLFETGFAEVVNKWKKIKGELPCKYTQRELPGDSKILLDLFIATENNWGLILAIRTGSAEYSHKVLATSWVQAGYTSKDGYLWKDGKKYDVREERKLFERIGVKYVAPEYRDL